MSSTTPCVVPLLSALSALPDGAGASTDAPPDDSAGAVTGTTKAGTTKIGTTKIVSGGRRAATTFVDQGLSSVSSFAMGVAVARVAGAAGLGAFAFAYTAWLVLVDVHRGLLIEPMAIEGDGRREGSDVVRRGFAAEVWLALAATAAFLVVGVGLRSLHASAYGAPMLFLAPWIVVLQLQDYWRQLSIICHRPGRALVNDLVFNVFQAAGLVAIFVTHVHSSEAAIGAWGLGGLAGAIYGLYQYRTRPTCRGGLSLIRSRWGIGRWLTGSALIGWGSSQAYVFVCGALLGPVALGGLKAAQALVSGPAGVLVQAGGSIGLPEASKAYEEKGWNGLVKVARVVTAVGALSFASGAVALALCGGPLLSRIYGAQFAHMKGVAVLLAVAYVFVSLSLGPLLVLKQTRNAHRILQTQMTTLVVSVCGVALLTYRFGVTGTACASIVNAVFGVSVMRWHQRGIRPSAAPRKGFSRITHRFAGSPFGDLERGRPALNGQTLDLQACFAILRRRWVVLAVVAVLGAAGGFAFAVRHAPPSVAAAEVLLPATTPSGVAVPADNTQTQMVIATSDGVLVPAAASVSPPISADQLARAVTTSAVSTDVLRIEARASTPQRAVEIAGSVAKQYQRYVKGQKAIGEVTTLIQPAIALPTPSLRHRAVKYSSLGLALGLLVGSVGILFRARPDQRLRRRDQIAGAIGVPVLASVETAQYQSISDWRRLLEHFDAAAVNAWALRPVLNRLVPVAFEGERTIHVVSFVGDKAALATGPELALFAADSGIPTRLAPSDLPALEPLTAACATIEEPRLLKDARLVVSVVVVDRSNPEMDEIPGPTILAVSSGFAGADDLARVALVSTKLGREIDGIVVVNPDPTDGTVGAIFAADVWEAGNLDGMERAKW